MGQDAVREGAVVKHATLWQMMPAGPFGMADILRVSGMQFEAGKRAVYWGVKEGRIDRLRRGNRHHTALYQVRGRAVPSTQPMKTRPANSVFALGAAA